jgi:hypothetical protein
MLRGRSLVRAVGVSAGALGLVLAGAAHAASDAGFELDWQAPDGCPSARAVQADIDRLLGEPADVRLHGKRRLRVRAEVEHGQLWQVTLDTTSPESSGHRIIGASSCQGLANATALIVALMIDPGAVAVHDPKAASEAARADAPSPPASPPAPVHSTATRQARILVGAGASGNLGLLPAPGLGVLAQIGLAPEHWRFELRAAYGLRTVKSDPLADPAGAHGEFQDLFLGSLSGCRTASPASLEYGACAGVEAGVIHGRGVRASTTDDKYEPWLGVGLGGYVAFRAGRVLAFPVHLDAVVPLWRPTYVFTNVQAPIFRSWPVGARLSAAAELRF